MAVPAKRRTRVWRRRLAVGVLAATAFAALAVGRKGPGPEPYVWRADIPGFGGLSGLVVMDHGQRLLAVSDAGYLIEAKIKRDGAGRIVQVTDAVARRFLQNHGQEVNRFQGDAEALRLDRQGRLVVAFESYTRFARLSPPDMKPEPLNDWNRFKTLWTNESVEGLAIDASGDILAVLEVPQGAPPTYRTLAYHGGRAWSDGPPLATDGGFQATDADFGPDGRLYVLERSLSLATGYKTRISAYPRAEIGFGPPNVVAETNRGEYGNFEGMDVQLRRRGELVATLISDNNFMPDAATVILEMPLAR